MDFAIYFIKLSSSFKAQGQRKQKEEMSLLKQPGIRFLKVNNPNCMLDKNEFVYYFVLCCIWLKQPSFWHNPWFSFDVLKVPFILSHQLIAFIRSKQKWGKFCIFSIIKKLHYKGFIV